MTEKVIAWDPAIVAVAPNGARRTPADHPRLPMTPAQLADCAAACAEAGAAMIHLHVRDAHGAHSLDPVVYREALDRIAAAVGDRLIVQITTEAVGRYTRAEQIAAVRAVRPEAASAAVRELCPDAAAELDAGDFYAWARRERVQLQHILYDPSDVRRLLDLRARGVIADERPFVLFVLGRYASGTSTANGFTGFLDAWNDAGPWAVCAFGAAESVVGAAALALNGHVRVGFENNLMLRDGSLAYDNAALIEQVARDAKLLGRPLANADVARTLLGFAV